MASAKRVTVYVDGFNLYYGLLVPNPAWKWLDLAALARSIRPGDVTRVRYFTAKVRPVPDPSPQIRPRLYLKALATLPDLSIHNGHFTTHPTRKALVYPAPGGPKTVDVWKTEEKGPDVNLAMYLLLDGIDGLYDEAVVISGDSDLVGPVREANRRVGPVHVFNPRNTHSDLARAATSYAPLDPRLVAAKQLPDTVMLPTGRTVSRPPSYR